MLLCCWLCKGSLRSRRLEVVGERENGRGRGNEASARKVACVAAGPRTRQNRLYRRFRASATQASAREKTEKGKRLSVASFSTSTLSLSSCQCRAPIVRFNRYSGTSPLGHFYPRDTKNVHIIFVFVTSFEATPLFRGKGHFFKVPTPRFNLHSGDT